MSAGKPHKRPRRPKFGAQGPEDNGETATVRDRQPEPPGYVGYGRDWSNCIGNVAPAPGTLEGT